MNPIASVCLDAAALLAAIGLITVTVVRTDVSVAKFFILPLFLLCAHVYGNTVQELEIGPEWLRGHLHNVGVAGISMVFALTGMLRVQLDGTQGQQRLKYARWSMNMVVLYWIVFTLLGIGEEVLNGTLWSEKVKLEGYSGQIDWFDILAYAIGASVVTINYFWLKPKVVAKIMRMR